MQLAMVAAPAFEPVEISMDLDLAPLAADDGGSDDDQLDEDLDG
jgi:hypothetical protein